MVPMRVQKLEVRPTHEPTLSGSSRRKEAHSISTRSSEKRSEPFDRLRVYLVTSAATLDWWVHGLNVRPRLGGSNVNVSGYGMRLRAAAMASSAG